MLSNIWNQEDKKLNRFEEELKIPDSKLNGVKSIKLRTEKDFDKIPKGGGCYWIWTKEPILHTLHKGTLPKRFSKFKRPSLSRIKSPNK